LRAYISDAIPWATQVYNYWYDHMINNGTGQVADHLEPPRGDVTWWSFTYNQGLMIGAALYLSGATKQQPYLNHALLYAQFMINSQSSDVPGYGRVLMADCGSGCTGDCAQFKGPSFRYLIMLRDHLNLLITSGTSSSIISHEVITMASSSISALLKSSIDAMWSYRDQSRNLFSCNWQQPYTNVTSTTQAQQNTAVSSLSLYAYYFK
jgi:predicted alpha-1,6-mannanase (GH76 family)